VTRFAASLDASDDTLGLPLSDVAVWFDCVPLAAAVALDGVAPEAWGALTGALPAGELAVADVIVDVLVARDPVCRAGFLPVVEICGLRELFDAALHVSGIVSSITSTASTAAEADGAAMTFSTIRFLSGFSSAVGLPPRILRLPLPLTNLGGLLRP
jgi:hypothetical protein